MRFTVRGQDGAPDRHVRVVVHLVLTWRGGGLARARGAVGARVAAWANHQSRAGDRLETL